MKLWTINRVLRPLGLCLVVGVPTGPEDDEPCRLWLERIGLPGTKRRRAWELKWTNVTRST